MTDLAAIEYRDEESILAAGLPTRSVPTWTSCLPAKITPLR